MYSALVNGPRATGHGPVCQRTDSVVDVASTYAFRVTIYQLGKLTAQPALEHLDLLATVVRGAVAASPVADRVGVVEIDPSVSDTEVARAAFELPTESLANCVIVAGKREGVEKIAACVVLAHTRADINSMVKRLLNVRKASFLPMDAATTASRMEYGGITPIGLPDDWPVYVDSRVVEQDLIIIGSGVRHSKIIIPGSLLEQLAPIQVIDNLAKVVD